MELRKKFAIKKVSKFMDKQKKYFYLSCIQFDIRANINYCEA